MHELSIALNIIEAVEEEAARQGGGRITAVHLKIGALSGVVKAALKSAFEIAREGTSMNTAQLVIEEAPVVIFCPSCAEPRRVESEMRLTCPICNTPSGQILEGKEMLLVALEME
jgi:hydrogenase nickel incorporation protein HypA/HybF